MPRRRATGAGEHTPTSEERRARERLEQYLAPVYESPLLDERALSVRGVCKQLGMSPNTLYKYQLDQMLAAAERFRTAQRQKAGIDRGSHTERALQRLKAERDEWERKYHNLLEDYVNLQHSIRLEPNVDLERVLKRRLPKAVRDAPGRSARHRRDQ